MSKHERSSYSELLDEIEILRARLDSRLQAYELQARQELQQSGSELGTTQSYQDEQPGLISCLYHDYCPMD